MQEYYSRGFKGARAVQVSESAMAQSLRCSVRTLKYHLKIGEFAGIIKRHRMGEGRVSIIELLLRPESGKLAELSLGIKAQLPNLHPALLEGLPRTQSWWLKRITMHESAVLPMTGRMGKVVR